ncbi:hypothetical protein ABT404_51360, partial [Streptomyces hyaluromycini]
MMRAGAWRDTWGRRLRRRIVQRPYPYAVLLGCLAVAESLAELVAGHGSVPRMSADAASGTGHVQLTLVIGLFCLATALPPLFLRPLAAGVTVTAASLGSLTILHTLTVAGLAAQLVVQYRLARTGATPLALLLGAPFLALALAPATVTDMTTATALAVRTVLLA